MTLNLFYTASTYMVFYQEISNYINYSKNNIIKYKYLIYMFFLFNNNKLLYKFSIIKYLRLMKRTYTHVRIRLINLIKQFMLFINACIYNSKGRIKMVGRGYKIIKKINGLIIRLGYSHLLFIHLIPTMRMKIKKKKSKFYTFYGPTYDIVNNITSTLHIMRLPDLYTDKGVFHRRIHL